MLESIKNLIMNHIEIGTISLFGILTFLYNHFKDRERFQTSSKFFTLPPDDEHGCYAGISVKAVNKGRRPIILTKLVVEYDNGGKSGIILGHPKGLTLNEREQYTKRFEDGCTTMYNPEFEVYAKDMWFEDTLGRKFPVKDAKKNLDKVWKIVRVIQKIENEKLDEKVRLLEQPA